MRHPRYPQVRTPSGGIPVRSYWWCPVYWWRARQRRRRQEPPSRRLSIASGESAPERKRSGSATRRTFAEGDRIMRLDRAGVPQGSVLMAAVLGQLVGSAGSSKDHGRLATECRPTVPAAVAAHGTPPAVACSSYYVPLGCSYYDEESVFHARRAAARPPRSHRRSAAGRLRAAARARP